MNHYAQHTVSAHKSLEQGRVLTDVTKGLESGSLLETIVTFLLQTEEDPRSRVVIIQPHARLSTMVETNQKGRPSLP